MAIQAYDEKYSQNENEGSKSLPSPSEKYSRFTKELKDDEDFSNDLLETVDLEIERSP